MEGNPVSDSAKSMSGRVVFITGAGRGQGRSHAVRFASAGASIVAVDICAPIESVAYPLASERDLAETARLVVEAGGDVLTVCADVRDRAALDDAVRSGVERFGRLDVVLANAGIFAAAGPQGSSPQAWRDTLDVNLTGVYNTLEAAIPSLLAAGSGSVVITNSCAGLRMMNVDWDHSTPGYLSYGVSKHALVGLLRGYALMLAPLGIRVNAVHPTGVATGMIMNEPVAAYLAEVGIHASNMTNRMPVEMIESRDVSNAVFWLCSDGARYVTGVSLPVDAGVLAG